MSRASAVLPFRNGANRCCCTSPKLPGNTRPSRSRGLPCEKICAHAECRARMLCPTGRASSVTPGSRGKARRAPTGSAAMNNPLHILQTLDRHLTKPAEITIFGRAALALGFPNSPATFTTTNDVDAILPLAWLAAEEQNLDF